MSYPRTTSWHFYNAVASLCVTTLLRAQHQRSYEHNILEHVVKSLEALVFVRTFSNDTHTSNVMWWTNDARCGRWQSRVLSSWMSRPTRVVHWLGLWGWRSSSSEVGCQWLAVWAVIKRWNKFTNSALRDIVARLSVDCWTVVARSKRHTKMNTVGNVTHKQESTLTDMVASRVFFCASAKTTMTYLVVTIVTMGFRVSLVVPDIRGNMVKDIVFVVEWLCDYFFTFFSKWTRMTRHSLVVAKQ